MWGEVYAVLDANAGLDHVRTDAVNKENPVILFGALLLLPPYAFERSVRWGGFFHSTSARQAATTTFLF